MRVGGWTASRASSPRRPRRRPISVISIRSPRRAAGQTCGPCRAPCTSARRRAADRSEGGRDGPRPPPGEAPRARNRGRSALRGGQAAPRARVPLARRAARPLRRFSCALRSQPRHLTGSRRTLPANLARVRNAPRFDHNMCGQLESGDVDRLIAALADRQHGVVSRGQLLDAGTSRREVEHRLKLRRLHALYRGVYAVGHRRLTRQGRWMGAVLADGPGAVASHRMAGAIWGFWRSDHLEATAPAWRARPGIQIHTSSVPGDEATIALGIPVTGVSRTLLDLAAVLRPTSSNAPSMRSTSSA